MPKNLKKVGIFLIIVGIFIWFIGLLFFGGANYFSSNFDFNTGSIAAFAGFFLMFFGGLFVIVGIIMLFYFSIGKTSKRIAKETASAAEIRTEALGRGLAKGLKKGFNEK